jgi:hypothetical protein
MLALPQLPWILAAIIAYLYKVHQSSCAMLYRTDQSALVEYLIQIGFSVVFRESDGLMTVAPPRSRRTDTSLFDLHWCPQPGLCLDLSL